MILFPLWNTKQNILKNIYYGLLVLFLFACVFWSCSARWALSATVIYAVLKKKKKKTEFCSKHML